MKLFAALALAMLWSGVVSAECICRCVNGEVRPICRSSLDVPPPCAPQVCPIVPPSIAPIAAPRVPPVGTTSCRQVQVYNPRTMQHEWREVCR